jgi:hypothetical protein
MLPDFKQYTPVKITSTRRKTHSKRTFSLDFDELPTNDLRSAARQVED